MSNVALTTTNSYRAHHNVSYRTLYLINSYWISSLNKRTLCWLPVACDTHIWGNSSFPEFGWGRERDSTLHILPNVSYCYSIHRSITSLQYCARISLNFIIICRLIASRERICLNFKSMSNAASADRSVLKDSSIIFFASFSITCQKKKKSRKKATNKPSLRVPVTILQKQSGKKGAKHKLVTWDGFPLCVSGSWCPVKNRLAALALIPPLTQFKMVERKFF